MRMSEVNFSCWLLKTNCDGFYQVVMSPHDPPQAFVDNFIRLLTDADVTEFQRVLEMKVPS